MLEPTNEAISAIINFITQKNKMSYQACEALVTAIGEFYLCFKKDTTTLFKYCVCVLNTCNQQRNTTTNNFLENSRLRDGYSLSFSAREQRGRLGFSWRLGAGRLAVLEGRMGVSYTAGREKARAGALALQRRLG